MCGPLCPFPLPMRCVDLLSLQMNKSHIKTKLKLNINTYVLKKPLTTIKAAWTPGA